SVNPAAAADRIIKAMKNKGHSFTASYLSKFKKQLVTDAEKRQQLAERYGVTTKLAKGSTLHSTERGIQTVKKLGNNNTITLRIRMRTTIDISDDLMKKAKIHAVKEGITLKQLFTRLLEKEVGVDSEKAQKVRIIKEMTEKLRTGDKDLDQEIEDMTQTMWKRLE
ncbi:MAG: hypothetical protein EBT20_18395, partial [Alphaproteobacteria bacterium]|nr:hypothetical protein [Alphaproteobacteria bacterium]